MHLVALRADGTFAGLFGTRSRGSPPTSRVTLPAGSYHLACRTSDERRVTAELTLPDHGDPVELQITLPDR